MAQDAWLLAEARELLRRRKEAARRDAGRRDAGRALAALENRVQAASGCGRLLRQRITRVYKYAVALGLDTLEDFILRRPWLARAMPAGRPKSPGTPYGCPC
ncbi:MAG: hypothetical protein LBT97_09045 [Planctomycetota bacterium]|nr:hypothetical protein [Planctomycetota bacterium]